MGSLIIETPTECTFTENHLDGQLVCEPLASTLRAQLSTTASQPPRISFDFGWAKFLTEHPIQSATRQLRAPKSRVLHKNQARRR